MGSEGLAGLLKVARRRSFKADCPLIELAKFSKTLEDGRKPESIIGASRRLGISFKTEFYQGKLEASWPRPLLTRDIIVAQIPEDWR
jgi:hypothetical protein